MFRATWLPAPLHERRENPLNCDPATTLVVARISQLSSLWKGEGRETQLFAYLFDGLPLLLLLIVPHHWYVPLTALSLYRWTSAQRQLTLPLDHRHQL